MRKIQAKKIVDIVEKLCLQAAFELPKDVLSALERGAREETDPRARNMLEILCENAKIAREESLPICQDTGMAVVFVELGEDVHVVGELKPAAGASPAPANEAAVAPQVVAQASSLPSVAPRFAEPENSPAPPNKTAVVPQARLIAAVNEGVRRGYSKGFLRKSVVSDPLLRKNTGDNTPAVVHVTLMPGDKLRIVVAPKGFGSENMSRLKMFEPTAGTAAVRDFVAETVLQAGGNPCPPIIVGVGIGGTMEIAALNAKRALLRKVGESNPAQHVAALEREMLEAVNATGVGPQGLGGKMTAMAVNIETAPTHIAGLPVAVNICCHAARHAEAEI